MWVMTSVISSWVTPLAIALGERLALPQVAVNHVVGVSDQCRRKRLDAVAFGGRRCLGHASLPCVLWLRVRGAAFVDVLTWIFITIAEPQCRSAQIAGLTRAD